MVPGRPVARAVQQIRGQHLVRPDGTIGLGAYGSVHVAGLTLAEVRAGDRGAPGPRVPAPRGERGRAAFNSKLYYVILDGGGAGQQVVRLPFTGNETVLDAIAQVNGLPPVSSKRRDLGGPARPPMDQADQVLPVDWQAADHPRARRRRTTSCCPATGCTWPPSTWWSSTPGWPVFIARSSGCSG